MGDKEMQRLQFCILHALNNLFEVLPCLRDEDDEFLTWFRQKAGVGISSVLSVGDFAYGRDLSFNRGLGGSLSPSIGDLQKLIYEFMSNGSLESLLYSEGEQVLSWEERLQISLDISHGIEYLHEGAIPPVIHRDLKSANILLDQSMMAKAFFLNKDAIEG